MRDVIIVGAGPGGSAAAKVLAEKGFDVALYEKRQEIGAPKRCAEGVGLDMLELLGLKPPKNCFRQGIDGARVYAPNGKYLEAAFSKNAGYICERKVFDKWLAEEAARAGAYIRAGTPITDVIKENGKVCGVKGKFFGEPFEERCKILIAADGIESKIARMAGLNTTCNPHLTDSGFQYEMAGIEMDDPHKLHIFFGNEIAPRGYVWIFPKGRDVANVGIGIYGRSDTPARVYLDRFIAGHLWLKDGSIIEANAGGIPVGGFLKKMTLDNFLVVGDAAHQVNPIHGGGIHEAQFGGKIAAEVAAEALQKGDTSENALDKYNKRWWKERGDELHRAERLREVLENLSDGDFDFLAEHLSGGNLIEFSAGKNLGFLAKLMIERPHLIKHARKLI